MQNYHRSTQYIFELPDNAIAPENHQVFPKSMGYHKCCTKKNVVSSSLAVLVVQGLAYWPLVPKFAGSNPAEAVGFLRAKKILSTPSFGGEVKPSVPCRRFAACKRSLELRGSRILGQNLSEHFSPTKSSTFRYQGSLASLDVKAPSREGGNV